MFLHPQLVEQPYLLFKVRTLLARENVLDKRENMSSYYTVKKSIVFTTQVTKIRFLCFQSYNNMNIRI